MQPTWKPDLVGRFMAVTHVDLAAVAQDEDALGEITAVLERRGLAPVPMSQMSNRPAALLQAYFEKDSTVVVAVTTNQVEYSDNLVQAVDRSVQAGQWEKFGERASEVLGAILNAVDRAAHRIALVTEEFATDETERPESAAKAGERLLVLPQGWGPSPITEWTWKYGMRKPEAGEDYNRIVTVQASTADVTGRRINGLWFQIDVNSSQARSRPRFTPENLSEQFEQLISIARAVQSDVQGLLVAGHDESPTN